MRPIDPDSLAPEQLEALRSVTASAAQQAAQALTQLTGLDLTFAAPRIRSMPVDDVPALLGGEEAVVVAIHLGIYGHSRGNILIALSPACASRLLDAIITDRTQPRTNGTPLSAGQYSEMEQSALLEIGNIISAAYLNAVGLHLGKSLLGSVPQLAVDMAGALVDYLLIEVTQGQNSALVMETQLEDGCNEPAGHILLLPDPVTLPAVLQALREKA